MIKAIVFDLDDTLIHEREFAYSAFNHIAKLLQEELKDSKDNIISKMKELYNDFPSKVIDKLFDYYNIKLQEDKKNYIINMYRNHIPNICLDENTKSILSRLKAMKIKLGIITDGYYVSQKNKIDALKLNDYIDKIIITDYYGRECWKPNQFAFKKMKEFFDIKFEEMIYIGDNITKDFIAPNELNMISVMYKNINGLYRNDLSKLNLINKPQLLIDDLSEIFNIIGKV